MKQLPTLPPRDLPIADDNGKLRIQWWDWLAKVFNLFQSGFTGTITTAKLTAGGANGSMTFVNGVLISQVAAT